MRVRHQVDDRGTPRGGGGHAPAPAARRLAPDLDPPIHREARDDALAGHDVGATVRDPRSRPYTIRDHRREGEQLPLERFLDRIEQDAPAGLAPTGRHDEFGRLVEPVRRRERQLHRPVLVMEADVLAIGGIVGQEVPSDRKAGFVRQATLDGDRRRPGPSGHASTRSIATGLPASARTTASSWTMLPSRMPLYSGPAPGPRRPIAAVSSSLDAWRGSTSAAASMSSGGGSRRACASWLSLVGWRTVTSTARSAPIGRRDRERPPPPPRRPGRTASCSRASAVPRRGPSLPRRPGDRLPRG